MKVFKFGGASVNSATAVENVADILQHFRSDNIVVVVSAMGKTTNDLESLFYACLYANPEKESIFNKITDYHNQIAKSLFADKNHTIFEELDTILKELRHISHNKITDQNSFYAQVVSFGEILSSKILSCYLNEIEASNTWLDVRKIIKTDGNYREANVDLVLTEKNIKQEVDALFSNAPLIVTQGFLGSSPDNATTTLGREGSDYTAALFAYSLNAESLTIWKDVPGLLNADPKYFSKTTVLERIPYREAIELAYYGATIIHPKTIKPLENKGIPLYVKSFTDINIPGSIIEERENTVPPIPSYIFKVKQKLLTISPLDFSFIRETDFAELFAIFAKKGIKVNVMQNSAISFSVCIDENSEIFEELHEELSSKFIVKFNKDLELITIRHFTEEVIEEVVEGREILLEQRSRLNAQIIIKSEYNS